ncbi:HAMP domain-containing protein [Candidatus Parcubacteria bacterium]|nr:HAMP domain-containing protein [Candidatus Parcubacteria bacterium]
MSLFKKITASFLIVSVIPITVFGIFLVNKIFNITKENVVEKNISIAKQTSWQIDTYFDTILKLLESSASLPEIKDFDKEKIDRILDSYYTSYTIYYGEQTVFEASPFESFTILDNQGAVRTVCPLDESYIGLDYSEQSFFQEVIQKKEPWLSSDISISKITGEPIVKIAVPVFGENKKISSIIEADIKLETLIQLTDQVKKEKTGHIFTINKKGVFITHPNKQLILKQENIEKEIPGLSPNLFKKELFEKVIFFPQEKPNTIIAYSFPKTVDWTVAFSQSLPEAFAVPLDIRDQFILIFCSIIIFVSLSAFYLSREITAPLKKLTKNVEDIGIKQDLKAEINIKTGDEIEELASSFNQMLKRLRIKTHKLEEKTKELQERVEELNKWYKMTIGREVRMVELKKEIKDLKEKLSTNKF